MPRELAADEAALVRQMARSDQNRLSLALADAAEADEIAKRLRKAAPKPVLPLILRLPDIDGQPLTLNLRSETDRESVREYLQRASPSQLAIVYRNVRELARPATSRSSASNEAEILRRQIDTIAKKLGLQAATGKPDQDCVKHVLLERDKKWHLDASDLDTEVSDSSGRYINVADLLFNPTLVPWAIWLLLGRRLRQLDDSVLDALTERLHQIRVCKTVSSTMQSACAAAQHLIRISRTIRDRTNLRREELRFQRTIEAAPRLLWPALRFFRIDRENSSHDNIELLSPDKHLTIRPEPSNYLLRTDPSSVRHRDQPPAPTTPTTPAVATAKPPVLTDIDRKQLNFKRREEIKTMIVEADARIAALPPDATPMQTADFHMRKDSLERQLAWLIANPSRHQLPGDDPSSGPALAPDEADARAKTLSGAAAPSRRGPVDRSTRDGSRHAPTATIIQELPAPEVEDDLGGKTPAPKVTSPKQPKPPSRSSDDRMQ